ncbi:hypothetical protein DEAC_c44730 [Desulfosporosinus acididurans]|uniref:Uncharacterized protein n=1 Tax=Desulfosporosinus acididurans TaxID=476652 RepID=A0A0J1FJL7_9FIRM|nr:hypothetical protein [Desulfosporosinus acididurans]KLU63625.1 hypothetical protein DEAC_c44730 [Desulfosporosinus acididurans]
MLVKLCNILKLPNGKTIITSTQACDVRRFDLVLIPHVYEDILKQLFLNSMNQLISNKDKIIENCKIIKQVLTDTASLDVQSEDLHHELTLVTELIRQCVDENLMTHTLGFTHFMGQ